MGEIILTVNHLGKSLVENLETENCKEDPWDSGREGSWWLLNDILKSVDVQKCIPS